METYLCSLLEWLLGHSNQDDCVRALSIFSSLLDFLDHILASGEIDKSIGAELFKTHLLLLIAGVNRNDVQAHGLCVLLSERTETATSSDDGNGLSWAYIGLLEALVNGDTSAQYRSDCVKRDIFV